MARIYEVLIHGTGFRVKAEDGREHREFFAHRWVEAKSTPRAAAYGVAAMQEELNADPRFQGDAQPEGSALTVEECYRLGWFTRMFAKAPAGLSFRQ